MEESSKGEPSPKISFLAGYLRPLCGAYAAAHYRASENTRITGPQKIKGAVLQGRPHAHAAVQLTDHHCRSIKRPSRGMMSAAHR
jgi:hypothetical protein